MIEEFSDIFHLQGDKLQPNEAFEHTIEVTGNPKPLNLKQFRIPFALKPELQRNMEDLLEKGIIEESTSPWNMPAFLVDKRSINDDVRRYRMVIDLRRLNDLVVQDAYPLPIIDEMLGKLGKAKYFSVLDLYSGFYQIALAPESRKYCSFSANNKKFQLKRLPMGLKNAPATFQKMMTKVLEGALDKSALLYMDDIIAYAPTLEDKIKSLRRIFSRLREHGLRLQPEKCRFLEKQTLYLGHLIREDGIFPDASKFECIENYPVPKTRKHLRGFLGLCNYYRKFIKDFGKIASCLNKLTSNNVDFKFEQRHMEAFNELKKRLINPPVLAHPDFDKPFVLTTDASSLGLGAVLSQAQDGHDKPIAFASRALNDREAARAKTHSTETELLAVAWGAKQHRPFLYGKKFILRTDNKALLGLKKMNNDNEEISQYREKLRLGGYDFDVEFKSGKINTNADALSRMYTMKIVTDPEEKLAVIQECHDSPLGGHKRAETTKKKIEELGFRWPNMLAELKKYIRQCKPCQENKLYKKTRLPMLLTDTPSRAWQKVALDFVENLPVSHLGFSNILTIQCNFTKYAFAVPLRSLKAEETAQAFAKIVLDQGIPEVILTDQGSAFMSTLFKNVCKIFKIKRLWSTAWHPQSNGSLERFHREFKEYFRHFIAKDQSNWDEFVDLSIWSHNTAVHTATGFTPFFLFHGREPNVPSSFYKQISPRPLYALDEYVPRLLHNIQQTNAIAREHLIHRKEVYKKQYDKHTNVQFFDVGDEVQLFNDFARQGRSKKLGPQWLGPYEVTEKLGDKNYRIKMGRTTKVVHADKLKKYYE